MMEVHDWEPSVHLLGSPQRELLNQISSQIEEEKLGLEQDQLVSLQNMFLVSWSKWVAFAENKSDEELVAWIKVWTLCPEQYSGFTDAARSPVIPLVRVLRQRGTYSSTLNLWIKEHSTNRFLPHGSLADRLR